MPAFYCMKWCHLLVQGRQQGLGDCGADLEPHHGQTMTEMPGTQPSRDVKAPVKVRQSSETEGPRHTCPRQPWQWVGSPRKEARAESQGPGQSLRGLQFKNIGGGDEERAISEVGRIAEKWGGNEGQSLHTLTPH